MRIIFNVVGIPIAQGSKKMVGPYRMVEAAKGHADWRNQVSAAAMEAAQSLTAPLDGPLKLTCVFRFPMPSSRKKSVQRAGSAWKTSAPDTDKLVRLIGDALTASRLIKDDARFALIEASKVEVTDWPGVIITVEQLDESMVHVSVFDKGGVLPRWDGAA